MRVKGQAIEVRRAPRCSPLVRGAVVVGLVCALSLSAPARSDAGWVAMLVQVVAVLENIRKIVQTTEEMTANATAEFRGLLDPGGLVSGVRSLSDWRGLYRQFLEVPEVWELAPKSTALVAEGLADYHQAAQFAGGEGWSGYDFSSLAGWNSFLASGPLSWTGGIGTPMGALESLGVVDDDTRAAFRSAVEAESVVHGMRYARSLESRLASASMLGAAVAEGAQAVGPEEGVLEALNEVVEEAGEVSAAESASDAQQSAGQTMVVAGLASTAAGKLGVAAARFKSAIQERDRKLWEAARQRSQLARSLERLAELDFTVTDTPAPFAGWEGDQE